MERSDLTELHYITPISNVASILDRGILSHDSASQIDPDSIADKSVQARRSRVPVLDRAKLHDYVNLYLNARNAMLYRLVFVELRIDKLCVMGITSEVLDFPEVVIADRNAASSTVRFYDQVDDGLAALDKYELFAKSWENDLHRQRMQAEVLVPGVVGSEHLTKAYVGSIKAEASLRRIASRRISITRNDRMFFL